MNIERHDVDAAAKAGVITTTQAEKLWSFWQAQKANVASFQLSHILYYLGGMIAITAVTLFLTQAWDKLQGIPLLVFSLSLFLVGEILTNYFLKKELRIPAGIMATFSLAVVPLIVYNIQYLLGYSPDKSLEYTDFHAYINWYWVSMELATIFVGIAMFYIYRFPFLLFPIAFLLWYMSMDLWPLFFTDTDSLLSDRRIFSLLFGLFILTLAIYIDFKNGNTNEDYSFWLYIFGVITFWGALNCFPPTNQLGKFIYCMINVVMLFVGAFLTRRVFVVFGGIGILLYLGDLSLNLFANSLGFPIALVLLGIIIIFAATYLTRIENKLAAIMQPFMPEKILKRMRK